ncbi:hypothetical protein RND81_01G222100 [Saponaria officinalis]|uniref:Thioredoxin domain-containing protein n=1 Tax=Saponaria officinalis TaxID=3572 RepID=A0AAW1N924_SAPOF
MAEEGQVIACHTNEQWTLNLEKGKKEGKLVVIDFTASWCGPCRVIAPILAECAKKYPNVLFLKVDVDELKDVAEAWGIDAMPTFIFVKDGEKIHHFAGASKDKLYAALAKYSEAASSASFGTQSVTV